MFGIGAEWSLQAFSLTRRRTKTKGSAGRSWSWYYDSSIHSCETTWAPSLAARWGMSHYVSLIGWKAESMNDGLGTLAARSATDSELHSQTAKHAWTSLRSGTEPSKH